MTDDRFELVISPTARRQLTDKLPEPVAFAAYEFIIGPLLDNPRRVGKRLDRHWPIDTAPVVVHTGSSTESTNQATRWPSLPLCIERTPTVTTNPTVHAVCRRTRLGAAASRSVPIRETEDPYPTLELGGLTGSSCGVRPGSERQDREVRHALEPCFRCSERYLDVKRSVRRGTCPPGTHTFDIWLPA